MDTLLREVPKVVIKGLTQDVRCGPCLVKTREKGAEWLVGSSPCRSGKKRGRRVIFKGIKKAVFV